MAKSKNVNKEASKVALQNQPVVTLPVDDNRNNPKFRKKYPHVVFANVSDEETLNANEMDSVTRSDPRVSAQLIFDGESPSAHGVLGVTDGEYDSDLDSDRQNRSVSAPPEGEPGVKATDAAKENYDADAAVKNDTGLPGSNSSQGYGITGQSESREDVDVLPPSNLAIDENTYVAETESLDGIATYSVTLSFDVEGQGLEYVPLLVKQP